MRSTRLIRMISYVFATAFCLLLHPALAEYSVVAAPQDVRFHSMNLRNIVHWSPGKDIVLGTTYTLEYAIYGDAVGGRGLVVWNPVEQCRNITHTECDLTEQTLDIHNDYYARVRANGPLFHSDWKETERRFIPVSDTILGPPHVKVTLVNSYMNIKLKGPFRYKYNGMKKGQSLWKIFPHMIYNISVYNNKSKRMQNILLQNDSLSLGPLEHETVYCVRAESHSLSFPLTSVQSDWSCITIPSDPFAAQMLVLMLGGVVPTAICLFVLAAVGGFTYYYVCGHNQKLPKSTDMVHMDEKQRMFHPEKHLTIFNLNFISTNLSTGESKLRSLDGENEHLLPIVALPSREGGELENPPPEAEAGPNYAVQPVQHQVESDAVSDTGSDPWPSQFLSDDYGLVLQQPQDGSTPGPSETKVDLYMAQNGQREAHERICREDEDKGTLVDWDPRTGVLKIPLLCQFSSEDPTTPEKETAAEMRVDVELLQRRPILTSVMLRQSSEENGEDDIFAKMEKDWGLQIQSSPE